MRQGAIIATALVVGLLEPVPGFAQSPVPSGAACLSETEPNDKPEQAPYLVGELCLAGTLVEQDDQDLVLWDVTPEDGLTTWAFTMRGVPATITSAHVFRLPDPISFPIVDVPEVFRADSDEHLGTPPITTETRLAPGHYLVGVSRGFPGADELTDDRDYELRITRAGTLPPGGDVEPNDDPAGASPVSGAFELSGDLAGSSDTYRWTLSVQDAARSWRLEGLTSVGAPLDLALTSAEAEQLASAGAAEDGSAAIHDLRLPTGDYVITLSGGPAAVQPYSLRAVEVIDTDIDLEPDDTLARALPLDPSSLTARGRLAGVGDLDRYLLEVGDDLVGKLLDITLTWSDGTTRMLCVTSEAGTSIGCLDGDGSVALSALVLPAGRYLLDVNGTPNLDDRYELRMTPGAAAAADHEAEPNDAPDTATRWDPAIIMHGSASGTDVDTYRIHADGEPALWRLDVEGTGLQSITWLRPDLTPMGSADMSADRGRAQMEDLYLIRGDHLLAIQADGEYTLALTEQGSAAEGAELEPNDDPGHAETLRLGSTRTGRLPVSADWDLYRFTLMAPGHVVLQFEPPADAAIDLTLMYGLENVVVDPGEPGKAVTEDLALPPGDYVLSLHATVPSREAYSLRLDGADPFDLADDQEPNDSINQARPLPPSLAVRGTARAAGDHDWYLLPPLAEPDSLRVRLAGEQTFASLTDGSQSYELVLQPDGSTYAAEGLPTGVPLFLDVSAGAAYDLAISGDGLVAQSVALDLAIALTPHADAGSVAGFRRESQHLAGTLTMDSTADTDTDLSLDGTTSQWDWATRFDPDHVSLPAGGSLSVPFTIEVPPDAWSPEPVRVTLRARDESGGQRTAGLEITVDPYAEPVDPGTMWTIPHALLGGLNVAATALGAFPGGTLDPEGERALYDGITADGLGFSIGYGALPVDTDVDLAGDAPVPVAGTILHPEGVVGELSQYPREFDLLLSEDGASWQLVLSGTLQPIAVDQAFALSSPVDARFARLRIRSKYGVTSGYVSLAEWKVVAAPGAAPSAGPTDIADPALGGHVVWMDPWFSDRTILRRMLDADRARETTGQTHGDEMVILLGFHDDRAAQVTELGWVDPDGSDPAARLGSVDVEVSVDSPLGPWRSLGTWSLERAEDGSVTAFSLPEGTWARYLKLHGPIPSTAVELDALELPASLHVMERVTDPDYRSILGEWGEGRPAGPYEWSATAGPPSAGDDAGDTAQTATPMPPDATIKDQVRFGVDEDWFAITVPEGQDTLSISVAAQPATIVEPTLYDAEGREVLLTLAPGSAGSARWIAVVRPAETYRLRVWQPPFSSVVVFDVSGSLGGWVPRIMGAIRTFTSGVEPGREAIMIVPIEANPLLPDWSDQPEALRDAVDAWHGSSESSAMTALLEATTLLATRTGTHAIFLIHDAEDVASYVTLDLWKRFAQVRPVIFSVLVSQVDQATARPVFQDWSGAVDGYYQYATTQTDMDKALARMAAWLRRTAAYELTWWASQVEHPPSSLTIEAPEGQTVPIGAGAAVELVLDTSGSMLEELGTSTRILVAKEVLVRLVNETLPEGLPVALRTFKAKKKSCDTELAVELGPLDRAAMSGTIGGLAINKGTRTPLGAALEAVAGDLGDASGPRVVVLVTDGAETCQGDPGAAVRALREAGFEATVNIVGFALDDPALKEQMAGWAVAGGGQFFDAQDQESLLAGISAALQAPFRVYDQDGAQVGSGIVGGAAIELPPGIYRVEVLSDPPTTFERVEVPPAGNVQLRVGEEP